jgi:hypothetical protein
VARPPRRAEAALVPADRRLGDAPARPGAAAELGDPERRLRARPLAVPVVHRHPRRPARRRLTAEGRAGHVRGAGLALRRPGVGGGAAGRLRAARRRPAVAADHRSGPGRLPADDPLAAGDRRRGGRDAALVEPVERAERALLRQPAARALRPLGAAGLPAGVHAPRPRDARGAARHAGRAAHRPGRARRPARAAAARRRRRGVLRGAARRRALLGRGLRPARLRRARAARVGPGPGRPARSRARPAPVHPRQADLDHGDRRGRPGRRRRPHRRARDPAPRLPRARRGAAALGRRPPRRGRVPVHVPRRPRVPRRARRRRPDARVADLRPVVGVGRRAPARRPVAASSGGLRRRRTPAPRGASGIAP